MLNQNNSVKKILRQTWEKELQLCAKFGQHEFYFAIVMSSPIIAWV